MSTMTAAAYTDEELGLDFSDLERKYAVAVNEDYNNVLVLENLPIVDQAKEEKLLTVLRKNIFSPASAIPTQAWMPRGSDGMSKGHLFLEFETVAQAEQAYQAAHKYRLDKSHVIFAIRFGDFERLALLDGEAEYKEPTVEPFQEREFLRGWLTDPLARDQFVCHAAQTVSVLWNGPYGSNSTELAHSRPNWTDSYVQWSPYGSYLATLHGPGVMLWGGASWSRMGKFPHANVKLISFSTCETFLITWSPFERQSECNLLVWDIAASKLVRGWVVEESPKKQQSEDVSAKKSSSAEDDESPGKEWIWPLLKFSHDDSYCVRIHDDCHLSIHETQNGFALLDKKPLEVPGIREVSWSPADNNLVYWTAGSENTPARVALLQIPSRRVLRAKNLFNVLRCRVSWHQDADYLCVVVDRHGKNRKFAGTHLEVFRLRDRDIPVEVVEQKENPTAPIIAAHWEPRSDRLLVAQAAEFKNIISLYTMTAMEGGVAQVRLVRPPVDVKQMSRFVWSPKGDHLVMASLDSTSAFLEFWNMSDGTLLATKDHFLATDVQWDPSGRYVASWVSYWRHQMDNGYVIWDFKGDQQVKQNQPKFSYFAWRPRPPSHLSREEEKRIRKNLKTYSARFDEHDQRDASRQSSNLSELRNKQTRAWNLFRIQAKLEWEERRAKRESLSGIQDFDPAASTVTSSLVKAQEWIEEVVEETEEIIQTQ